MSNRNAASLTGSLLARKGAAAPSHLERGAGYDAPPPSRFTPTLAPEQSPVALRAANGKPRLVSAKAVPGPSGGKAAASRRFTLRLSQEQHLQLRLASVHLGLSGQKMLLKALDEYLGRIAPELAGGNCACLLDGTVAPLPARTNRANGKKKPAR